MTFYLNKKIYQSIALQILFLGRTYFIISWKKNTSHRLWYYSCYYWGAPFFDLLGGRARSMHLKWKLVSGRHALEYLVFNTLVRRKTVYSTHSRLFTGVNLNVNVNELFVHQTWCFYLYLSFCYIIQLIKNIYSLFFYHYTMPFFLHIFYCRGWKTAFI